MDEADALLIAYRLSILAFYIGVLIYALPIPIGGLKRWAPTLMGDAVLAAILSLAFFYILDASNYIAGILGGSWELFSAWYRDAFSAVVGIKTILITLYTIPDPTGISDAIASMLAPVDKAVTAALIFLASIGGLGELVVNYSPLLAAIGVGLYAVPFRLTRSAGAWLIAFALVFNAGLQVLPVFISTIADAPESPVNPPEIGNVVFAEVRVVDNYGNPIRGGILHVYNETWSEVAVYLVDSEGYAISSSGERTISLPDSNIYIDLELNGILFPTYPSPITPDDYNQEGSTWSLEITAPDILWSPGPYMIVYTTGYPYDAVISDTSAEFTVELYLNHYIEAAYPVGCSINLYSDELEASQYTMEWRGIDVEYYTLYPHSYGLYTVEAYADPCNLDITPDVEVKDYWQPTDINFVDYNLLAAFILYYFTIPLLYIFLLFAATMGVARLLGGRDRLQVRVV